MDVLVARVPRYRPINLATRCSPSLSLFLSINGDRSSFFFLPLDSVRFRALFRFLHVFQRLFTIDEPLSLDEYRSGDIG